MEQYQEIFRRYEKKYLMEEDICHQFIMRNLGRILPDKYGRHTICNIYYDTEDYELIRRSVEKPVYKEKLRLRSYGVPDKQAPVFAELKKKYRGVVYKRRKALPLAEAVRYLEQKNRPESGDQILKEINWFLNFYRPVPKVYIAYDRVAYYGKDEDIRITLDTDIRFRDTDLFLERGSYGRPLLEKGQFLMEIKIPDAMPLWLSRELAALSLYPVSYSKYGSCYQNFIIKKESGQGGIICA